MMLNIVIVISEDPNCNLNICVLGIKIQKVFPVMDTEHAIPVFLVCAGQLKHRNIGASHIYPP